LAPNVLHLPKEDTKDIVMKNQLRVLKESFAGAHSRPSFAPILVALLLFTLAAAANATTFTVTVGPSGQLVFSPATETIKVGDTVKWTWESSFHSSTSGTPGHPDGMWDSGILNSGATFSFTFTTAGTFAYFCTVHGSCCTMIGSITVTAPTPTPTPTPSPTPTATPSPTPTPSTTSLGNISTRLAVQTGDNVLIGGFIVTGTQPKKVLLRAIGPSLSNANPPVAGALADPVLELHDGTGALLATNDNWMDAPNMQEIIDSTIPPSDPAESAILMTLPANSASYTAIVQGVNNTTGIALVEAYDLDTTVDSKLANISTRGFVQTVDNVMIGGFIVLGPDQQTVIVRAIGPSLADANPPVVGALADPTLELHDGNGAVLASNDNWQDNDPADKQAIIDSGIAPTNDLESAIITTLPSSVTGIAYTAIVSGVNGTTGVGLVEVYALAP